MRQWMGKCKWEMCSPENANITAEYVCHRGFHSCINSQVSERVHLRWYEKGSVNAWIKNPKQHLRVLKKENSVNAGTYLVSSIVLFTGTFAGKLSLEHSLYYYMQYVRLAVVCREINFIVSYCIRNQDISALAFVSERVNFYDQGGITQVWVWMSETSSP